MSHTTANTAQLRRSQVWSTQLKDVLQDELMAQGYVRWLTEFPDGDTFNILCSCAPLAQEGQRA